VVVGKKAKPSGNVSGGNDFNPQWHYEYGALYGVTVPESALTHIERHRTDKTEIERLALYNEVKGKEKIAPIDEKLLEYWNQ